MAATEYVSQFEERSEALLAWKTNKDSLVRRPGEWGTYDFTDSQTVIERMFQMVEDLSELSINLIDDGTLSNLNSVIESVESTFKQIDTLDTAAMVNNRDSIVANLSSYHDQMLSYYKQEVAWLTIFAGKLETWITPAKQEFERTRTIREEAERHRDDAAQAAVLAREKAGEAGAAEFTAGFRQQAERSLALSNKWLVATLIAFVLALATTVFFVWLHATGRADAPESAAEAIIYVGWRVGTVSLLFWSAIWCGRHFRAHAHNREVNQHRAVCLENMRAFHASVKDQGIKDLVALEFARSATQGMPTGFISGKAEARSDGSPNVIPLTAGQTPSPNP